MQTQSFITKDSGDRRGFDTGAVRDVRTGKGRYDLMSPVAMRRECQLLERGAIKYGDRNWEKGMPISTFLDSAIRHIFNYLDGEATEDHLAAARWNIGCAMQMEERHPELQDIPTRPDFKPPAPASPDPMLYGGILPCSSGTARTHSSIAPGITISSSYPGGTTH